MTIASLIRTLLDTYEGTDAGDRTGMRFRIKVAVALLLLLAAMHVMVGGIIYLASSDLPLVEAQIHSMPD